MDEEEVGELTSGRITDEELHIFAQLRRVLTLEPVEQSNKVRDYLLSRAASLDIKCLKLAHIITGFMETLYLLHIIKEA